MDEHIRTLRKEELLVKHQGWFDEANAERVVSWLVAAEDLDPVVLVGAGFSLNACDRKTGRHATTQQAPLWKDLIPPLATDLGVPTDRYDAPTLFELYEEEFGKSKLRQRLLDAVADEDLAPGEAHMALGTYPCAAVVTTNCLDTLLDLHHPRRAGWRHVVEDAHLSAHGERDLIYLHGHRSFPGSWVLTRSQYEDFSRVRPVMTARVRQLLAQHPWLIVGFGMGDPNFHAITRLLGTEMRGHQPLSLALMASEPIAAERQHWRRLGFEMAVPSLNGRDFRDFLAWVFPKLATRYSPTSEAAKSYIERGGLEERLRRFHWAHPPSIGTRAEVFQSWKRLLEDLLSREEWEDANLAAAPTPRLHNPYAPKVTTPPHRVIARESPLRDLRSDVLRRISQAKDFQSIGSVRIVRVLDCLLSREDQVLRAELAKSFAWALERRLFEDASERPLWEVVAIHLAKGERWQLGRIEGLIQHTLASVQRYDDKGLEEVFLQQLPSLDYHEPPVEAVSTKAHLAEAEAARRALMNDEFPQAIDKYERAASLASQADCTLEVWAYTVGQADAVARSAAAAGDQHEQTQRRDRAEALREQAKQLARQGEVSAWLRQAEERALRALQEEADRHQGRERAWMTGGNRTVLSGTAREIWKTYRDLHSIHAPPSLQQRYFMLLLPFLKVDHVEDAIAAAAKPEAWLESTIERDPGMLEARTRRDRMIVEAMLRHVTCLTHSERAARLRCFSEITTVLRKEDVPRALKWLEKAQALAKGGAIEIWPAFSAVACWSSPAEALTTARELIGQVTDLPPTGLWCALYDLPWDTWKLVSGDAADGFLDLLSRAGHPESDSRKSREGLSFAMFTLLHMIEAGVAKQMLDPYLTRWNHTLKCLKSKAHGDLRYFDLKRAGFLLERAFARLDAADKRDASDAFGAWFDTPGESDDKPDDQELWTTLSEVLPATDPCDESLLKRLETEVERLVSDQNAIRHYELNPHLGEPAVRLLVKGLHFLEDKRLRIAEFFVHLVEVAPNLIAFIHRVMRPKLWPNDSWNRLTQAVIAACGGTRIVGSDRDDPGLVTRCQCAALRLFARLDGSIRSDEPTLWCTLQGLALASVNDERLIVANLAAFGVVNAAKHVKEASDAALYGFALRRIANDARVEVRSAVAYAGQAVVKSECHKIVRVAAEEALALVQSDDNAQVKWLLDAAEQA